MSHKHTRIPNEDVQGTPLESIGEFHVPKLKQ